MDHSIRDPYPLLTGKRPPARTSTDAYKRRYNRYMAQFHPNKEINEVIE